MAVRANKPAFNIREKLKELTNNIGLKGRELMRAATVQEARDLVSAGRKNLMINGGFEVSQRGNYTSATSMVHNTYYLDRWKSDNNNTVTSTFNQITTDLPKQYRNLSNTGLRFEATSSNVNAYMGFRQRYEHMLGIDGKYVTVSAWVKSNRNAVLINYDGSGAPYQYAQHSGSGHWEYLSYTTLINYSNDANDYNYFDVFLINPETYGFTPINSGDYIEVTNYQVEIGKNATDFEHRSYGEELLLCQRYFQLLSGGDGQIVGAGFIYNTSGVYVVSHLRTTMREIPTIFSTLGGTARLRVNAGLTDVNTGNNPTISAGISSKNAVFVDSSGYSGLTDGHGCTVRQYLGGGVLGVQAEI